jgi:hypothetical protein
VTFPPSGPQWNQPQHPGRPQPHGLPPAPGGPSLSGHQPGYGHPPAAGEQPQPGQRSGYGHPPTAGEQPEPGQRPGYADGFGMLPLSDQPLSARSGSWKLFGGVTAAVLALCCGGLLGLGLLIDDPGANRAAVTASAEARNPAVADPAPHRSAAAPAEVTSSPKAPGTAVPSTRAATSTPARTRSATPKPARTTTRPAPTRTTAKPEPATKSPTANPTRQGVTPGAFCSPEGAFGIGRRNGRLYECRSEDGDQARWKRA